MMCEHCRVNRRRGMWRYVFIWDRLQVPISKDERVYVTLFMTGPVCVCVCGFPPLFCFHLQLVICHLNLRWQMDVVFYSHWTWVRRTSALQWSYFTVSFGQSAPDSTSRVQNVCYYLCAVHWKGQQGFRKVKSTFPSSTYHQLCNTIALLNFSQMLCFCLACHILIMMSAGLFVSVSSLSPCVCMHVCTCVHKIHLCVCPWPNSVNATDVSCTQRDSVVSFMTLAVNDICQ